MPKEKIVPKEKDKTKSHKTIKENEINKMRKTKITTPNRRSLLLTTSMANDQKNKDVIIHFLERYQEKKIPKKKRSFQISLTNELIPIDFQIPSNFQFSYAKYGFGILFGSLTIGNILSTLQVVLLEKSIVFVSSSLRVLSSSIFAILPLIYPFKWQGALIPVLPPDLLMIIESPVPTIVGVTKFPNAKRFNSNFLLVDLDNNKLQYVQNCLMSNKAKLPTIPYVHELFNTIKKVTKQHSSEIPFLYKNTIKSTSQGGVLSTYRSDKPSLQYISSILKVFKDYFNVLFSDFRRHTYSDVSSKNTLSVFLKESFLALAKKNHLSFLTMFLNTQCFEVYSNKQLINLQKNLAKRIKKSPNTAIAKSSSDNDENVEHEVGSIDNNNLDQIQFKKIEKYCELKLNFNANDNDKIHLHINFISKKNLKNRTNRNSSIIGKRKLSVDEETIEMRNGKLFRIKTIATTNTQSDRKLTDQELIEKK
ncbi:hypothetical protein M0812_01767 [Anaeramoeba flamelloides]|uniref:UDENN domain-containing protein n=1 Tax=Anaeramoeba flamelloides TaxID=1746091 RepID=A0AAV7YXV5_9EUKA|nr:hypothetical protein M0812_01767 [Anaeramoeba flamelloides]